MANKMGMSTQYPGLIFILVDQSASMKEAYGEQTKADICAMAVNRVIYEIGRACEDGDKIKDRCFVGVVGYGASVDLLLGGMISEIANNPKRMQKLIEKQPDGAGVIVDVAIDMPIWVEPKADNGTPMSDAFDEVFHATKAWVKKNPNNSPPTIINITDGQPVNMAMTKLVAEKLMELKTTDGNVLILNAHISNAAIAEDKLPNNDGGLHDEYARFLFSISSILPEPLIADAKQVGFSPQPNARGFVFNARPETMIKLLKFGSLSGLRQPTY